MSSSFLRGSTDTSFKLFGVTEKNAIVIEIGFGFIKCGFAGDHFPRHIIRTNFQTTSGKKLNVVEELGAENLNADDWKDAMTNVLNTIFFRLLQTNPPERRVVIVQSTNSIASDILLETVKKLLFEDFKIPALLVLPLESMCLVPLQQQTSLVVDCGRFETRVLPIFDRTPLQRGFYAVPLGSESLQNYLSELISSLGFVRSISDPSKTIESSIELSVEEIDNVIARLCSVNTTSRIPTPTAKTQPTPTLKTKEQRKQARAQKQEKEKLPSSNVTQKSSSPMAWPLKETATKAKITVEEQKRIKETKTKKVTHKTLSTPTIEQAASLQRFPLKNQTELLLDRHQILFEACEIFFDEQLNSESFTLQQSILQSLRKCAIDVRARLAQNLLLVGGVAMLPGFRERLLIELKKEAKADEELSGLVSEFGFMDVSIPVNYLGWLGASIVGSLEKFSLDHSITANDWANGNLTPQQQQQQQNSPIPTPDRSAQSSPVESIQKV